MQTIPILADIHTHCIASGHGTRDTITEMAREAAKRSLRILGISDHAPAAPGAADNSYFRNLLLAPRKRFGISLLYGAELNILNEKGDVDLDDNLIRAGNPPYLVRGQQLPCHKADAVGAAGIDIPAVLTG